MAVECLLQSCGVLVAVWLAWKCYLKDFVEVQRKLFETGFLKYFTRLVNHTTTGRKQKVFSVIRQMAAERDQPLKIVEIGAGPGANFEFLPSGTEITCVEPNEQFRQTLLENANKRPDIRLDLKCGKAEDLSCVETGSQDVCISTYVLCSVNDVDRALREMYRILKPGGKLVFIEHIRAVPGSWTLALQKVIRPIWYWFLDCNITRPTDVTIKRAGFSSTDIEIYGADEMVGGFPIVIRSLAKVISLTAAGSATK